MRLLNGTFTNFGSYRRLCIDFSNIGLGLVYGRTGSGKSTIPDMAAWTLFGVTAKDGGVDEVRSWLSTGEPTSGTLSVELPGGTITITRVRGNPKQNDLYWIENDTPEVLYRGKDLQDTQRKLNQRLGVDADLYLSGAYFHEFSPSGSFFTAKAKDRRALFERIATLVLPVTLAERASSERKATKDALSKATTEFDTAKGRLQSLKSTFEASCRSSEAWEVSQKKLIESLAAKAESFQKDKASKVADLEKKSKDFEADRESKLDTWTEELASLHEQLKDDSEFTSKIGDLKGKLQKLSAERCNECGGPKSSDKCDSVRDNISALEKAQYVNKSRLQTFDALAAKIEMLQASVNPYTGQLERVKAESNTFAAQVEAEHNKSNPFKSQLEGMASDIVAEQENSKKLELEVKALEQRVSALTQLYDLSFELRGELLKKAVRDIEASTNSILERHFDAELRVSFTLDADELEVSIKKSGYDCVYRQLSKGQRQLLKLSFVVSIMKASANRAGVHFANLFFDEALDGLDSDLKVKAFSLFSELETNHESILLIDHAPEFQNLFTKRYYVSMEEDSSNLELEQS